MSSKALISVCYTWGRNPSLKLEISKPLKLPFSSGDISSISLGVHHVALLTSTGSLYSYGLNKYSHLPHPTSLTPTHVPLPAVKQVQCGDKFTLALSTKGEVFVWGSSGSPSLWSKIFGKVHSLGIDTRTDLLVPTPIELPEEILEIACGREHCLALGKYGLYSWGTNDYGQLGEGDLFKFACKPRTVEFFKNNTEERVVKVFAAEYSSAVITNLGRVYVWGSNSEMQLGLNQENSLEYRPMLVPMTEIYAVKDAYCGGASTMLLTETNEVFVAGIGIWKKFEKFNVPNGIEPKQLCCGEDYFAVLGKDSRIAHYGGSFSGKNTFHELPDKVEITKPDFIPGEIKGIEGKYGYMAAITQIEAPSDTGKSDGEKTKGI